jgi:hypothetical protein
MVSVRRLVLVAVAALAFTVLAAGRAAAQDAPPEDTTTTLPVAGVPAPDIVPRPNSGRAPESATDPGGWAQYAVMFGIAGGVALIALLVVRESRKKKPQQPAP